MPLLVAYVSRCRLSLCLPAPTAQVVGTVMHLSSSVCLVGEKRGGTTSVGGGSLVVALAEGGGGGGGCRVDCVMAMESQGQCQCQCQCQPGPVSGV